MCRPGRRRIPLDRRGASTRDQRPEGVGGREVGGGRGRFFGFVSVERKTRQQYQVQLVRGLKPWDLQRQLQAA